MRPTHKKEPFETYPSAPDQSESPSWSQTGWLQKHLPIRRRHVYQQVTAEERRHSVATTLFNVWYRRMLERTFNDERLEWLWTGVDTRRLAASCLVCLQIAVRNPPTSARIMS